MSERVLSRPGGWAEVLREGDALVLRLGAGADRNHRPFTFRFVITPEHLDVLRDDVGRYLLADYVVRRLCERTNGERTPNKKKVRRLLDRILLDPEPEVDAWFRSDETGMRALAAAGADHALLQEGRVLAALRHQP